MPPAELPARKRWLALAVLCVTVLVANLDSTVLNVTLPTLVRDLNATSGDLQWIVDSYIVVFAGSLLAAGSLADRIGRKRTLLAGLAVFAGGSAWAAFSGDVGTLIAARLPALHAHRPDRGDRRRHRPGLIPGRTEDTADGGIRPGQMGYLVGSVS